ncbi:mycothiol synthase [Flaviflexus massiliensis]|uniref:mycothiol synthase n=1 Tax=Flaviflexus massiliensis TaxID=1522309 RepID=UPI0006D564FC|nr:mycothiol synthase [Flaviflexus massiliensis]
MRVSTARPDMAEFKAFAALVEEHDGVEAFGEASHRDVAEDRAARYFAIYEDKLIALAVIGKEGSELAVHPDFRQQGIGYDVVTHVASTVNPMRLWSHGNLPVAAALAGKARLEPVRELRQLSKELLRSPRPESRSDVTLRPYTEADVHALVDVNARAFVDHPEQGQMVAEDVEKSGGEIQLAESDGKVVGYYWIQRDPAELYVLGVDPEWQGRGLGGWLTAHTLADLSEGGADRVMLYVEGDNIPALATYERAGFSLARSDIQYEMSS